MIFPTFQRGVLIRHGIAWCVLLNAERKGTFTHCVWGEAGGYCRLGIFCIDLAANSLLVQCYIPKKNDLFLILCLFV